MTAQPFLLSIMHHPHGQRITQLSACQSLKGSSLPSKAGRLDPYLAGTQCITLYAIITDQITWLVEDIGNVQDFD